MESVSIQCDVIPLYGLRSRSTTVYAKITSLCKSSVTADLVNKHMSLIQLR